MSFLPQPLETHLLPELAAPWFRLHSLECGRTFQQPGQNNDGDGSSDDSRDLSGLCPLSSHPVAFHYVRPYEMYVFDYLLYVARVEV
jgi:hypothetical protein